MADAAADAAHSGLRVRLKQDAPIPLDVTLDCAAGELVALVGPSGSGKTTTLRCIAGLDRPREGVVACDGSVWLDTAAAIDRRPQRRAVGIVFQSYALFPHLSAAGNVAMAMSHLPARARVERARALLALVHLAGLEERRPAELSGGQQQRVAIARALAREPKVLLLDEPFAAVDQVTRRKLQRELVVLRRSVNIPIVLVTHDLEEASLLADRMSILHHGRTLQTAPPATLAARPASPLVARLIDLRNIFEGTVESHAPDRGTTWLRWRAHRLEAPYNPGFAPGSRVSWVIPPANVILHRRDRPSRGEHENPVEGTIDELVVLGETANAALRAGPGEETPLSFSVPAHVARRNRLEAGIRVKVSLLKDAIHLMPWENEASL